MIDKDFFYRKMKEAKELIGSKITKESVDLMYEKIHANFTNDDFDRAIFTAMSEGDIYYPNLIKWLEYYKEVRLELEEKESKKKEKEELKNILRGDEKDKCRYDYKCKSCPKTYCKILNNYGFHVVFSILNGEDKKAILTEAAKKFPDVWQVERHLKGKGDVDSRSY